MIAGNLAHAQSDSTHHHVAVFAPLYLDSAFDAEGNYRFAKQFPKFSIPGVDFLQGIQLAADSMQKEGIKMDVWVYDTRSSTVPIQQLLQKPEMDSMDLFIGHVSANEAKLLADAAAQRNVCFINANFPNDAGVTGNPHFIVLNSTLLTHCTGLYKFLQSNYALNPVVLFTKKGQQEDRLMTYINSIEKTTSSVPLKIKTVILENRFSPRDILGKLDSNKHSVCIIGSLDINFAHDICRILSPVSASYSTTIVGMPTWDVIDFTRTEFRGLEVVYSTPFYINPADKVVAGLNDYFKNNLYSKPGDMVFRGYEALYHFGHLLPLVTEQLPAQINSRKYAVFTQFAIEPVYSKPPARLEYYENKKLYFVRKADGIVKAVY